MVTTFRQGEELYFLNYDKTENLSKINFIKVFIIETISEKGKIIPKIQLPNNMHITANPENLFKTKKDAIKYTVTLMKNRIKKLHEEEQILENKIKQMTNSSAKNENNE